MAVTQNTYPPIGSQGGPPSGETIFPFTFPYLETTDIKVSLDGSATTAYTLANATTIQLNTAPNDGVVVRIYRQTDDTALAAQFYPGSAIRSQDLNDNFTQNLYVTQESNRESVTAITTAQGAVTTAEGAVTTANAATATANTALSTANTADTNASAAVVTANTASSNASSAVSTANSAASDAAAAVSTANSAASDATTAISTANGAVTTANSAAADAATAISTANAASSSASAAVSTANTASTNASNAVTTANSAVSTANSAVTTANGAVTTANAADTKADQAIAAVANAILYDLINNVASIPGSPSNNDAIEIVNSTGIESFTPLSNLPTGFVGDSGLSVRLVYDGANTTWNWIQYFPNDPEDRYGDSITTLQTDVGTLQTNVTTLQTDLGTAQTDIGTLQTDLGTAQSDITSLQSNVTQAQTDILGLDSSKLDVSTAASTYLTQSNAASTYQTQAGMSSYLTTATAASTYETQYTITTTATSKTLANRERCTVTAAGQTLTLPASPSAGFEVSVTIGGTFTDTVIARNGSNIMSLTENITIDKADVSVTLYYVDATRGWRII